MMRTEIEALRSTIAELKEAEKQRSEEQALMQAVLLAEIRSLKP